MLTVDVSVNLQLSQNSVGMFEAFCNCANYRIIAHRRSKIFTSDNEIKT
jgi:hypothetical protein